MSGPAPVSPADLTAGLRRRKLATMRELAPELLLTAKTQRWAPEEVLRTLIEAEIASRDASNTRARLKAAAFPVIKTIEEFDLSTSSIPAPTFAYLTSLEWIGAKENLALIGPAGTGKSHTLVALGHAAVHAGHKVRYFTAADLVETLYRGLADNSVGKTIDTLLGNELLILDEVGFASPDDTGTQLLFRFVAAAYERRSLAIASHWSFEDWGRFLPEHTTAVSLLDRLLHHATTVVTSGESYRMLQARTTQGFHGRGSYQGALVHVPRHRRVEQLAALCLLRTVGTHLRSGPAEPSRPCRRVRRPGRDRGHGRRSRRWNAGCRHLVHPARYPEPSCRGRYRRQVVGCRAPPRRGTILFDHVVFNSPVGHAMGTVGLPNAVFAYVAAWLVFVLVPGPKEP